MEGSSRLLILRVVADQVLGTQILADLGEGFVQAAGADVVAFAAGLLGKGDERVFAAQVAEARRQTRNLLNRAPSRARHLHLICRQPWQKRRRLISVTATPDTRITLEASAETAAHVK